ncbi:MAG: FlgD immunoglobulin-like domain containing protein, partial [Bacteroidota bacterium]|nr:T9SS type A sorting domain-containing protein [Bacteroidota bacterium]
LEQNYPNPFNPTTSIRFSLPISKAISIVVYDMLGNEVKTLIDNEEFSKGSYEVTWDGTNSANQKVASGNYIYTMKYGNFSKSVKMTFLK